MSKVGFLHPGEMGIFLATSAINSGQQVYWCSVGRSQFTHNRAQQGKLNEIPSLHKFSNTCEIIVSVCPPHAAAKQAQLVIEAGFKGIYVDANAISPESVTTIAESMQDAGIKFVDGGIIGVPTQKKNTTWLYLSGSEAMSVANCFEHGPLETSVLGPEIGKASALKMCFAANSKGMRALQTAILGAAEKLGVREALEKQWDTYTPGFSQQTKTTLEDVARKAWRYSGEMKEIAATLHSAGMPAEFHLGAADIFSRQSGFKDAEQNPTIEDILKVILKS